MKKLVNFLKKGLIFIIMISIVSNSFFINGIDNSINSDETLTDKNNKIIKSIPAVSGFTLDSAWGTNNGDGTSGSEPGQFWNPENICANASGYIFVADWSNHRIQRFQPDGTYDGEIAYQYPQSMAMDLENDILYVAGSYSSNVSLFYTNGTFIRYLGTQGSDPGQFWGIWGICMNSTHVFISDEGNHEIDIFDKAGNFIDSFGGSGSEPGKLTYPRGVAVNSTGQIFVYDHYNDRIQIFEPGSFNLIKVYPIPYEEGTTTIYINQTDAIFFYNRIYDSNLNEIGIIAPIGEGLGELDRVSGFLQTNDFLYVSDCYNERINLFKYERFKFNLDYRSVGGKYNITTEIWRFGDITNSSSLSIITNSCIGVSKYRIATNVWNNHPMITTAPLNVSKYDESTQTDILINKISWGTSKQILIPNLFWKFNKTGVEIAAIVAPGLDPLYDNNETGSNWVKFTSTNPSYAKYFVFIKVNSNGFLEEYQICENRDILHIILEPNIVSFLSGLGISYSSSQDPIYMSGGSQMANNLPSSSNFIQSASSNSEYPIFPYDAQESATLYRIIPNTTITVVQSYESDHLTDVMEDTFIISEPKLEMQTTQQLATVEYFDEDTGKWQPSDNGKGGNTFIIGSANKESLLPLVLGQNLQVPLIKAQNVPLPSIDDIKEIFGDDVVATISDNALYIEYTYEGNDYYLDVDYGTDGKVSKLAYRLPLTTGIQDLYMTSISEEEVNEYIQGYTPTTNTGDSNNSFLTEYFVPIIIGGATVIVVIVVVAVLLKKKKIST